MTEDKNGAVDVENLSAEQIAEIEASDEFITNFKEEDYDDPDKVEELRKHVANSKTTINQKRHFRDKVTKLEDQIKNGSGKPPVKKEGEDGNGKPPVTETKGVDPVSVVTFRQDNPSLSKATVAEITRIAGAFGISMEEAAGSETGKAVIKNLENKESNANATLPPSRKAGTGLEKKDWSNASPAEIEAQRRQMMGQI